MYLDVEMSNILLTLNFHKFWIFDGKFYLKNTTQNAKVVVAKFSYGLIPEKANRK